MKIAIKKHTLIAVVILCCLAVAFGVLLTVYLIKNREDRTIYEQQRIRVVDGDAPAAEYTLDELLELAGGEQFSAVYKPSGRTAVTRTYTGISLNKLLTAMGIEISGREYVKFKASDGMEKLYSIEDVADEGNVFIAYLVNGKPFNKGIDSLAYGKPEEDGGPYVVIKAKDAVSQNRVKLLVEICVK